MIDFEKYIGFVDNALKNAKLSDEKREEMIALRDKIVERHNDPNLYLSMLSDFSAGKSTIINKIVGKPLLRTANLATTSIPTYIENTSEGRTSIVVTTFDGKLYRLTNQKQRRAFEKKINMTLPDNEQQLIAMLTTDEAKNKLNRSEISDSVKNVRVKTPYDSDVRNICIIDTPGVNPGMMNTSEHVKRTISILENVADSVIVIFPAHQNYSAEFQSFMEKNARLFLRDAVFVVNMMDLIDEEERYEVIKDVECKLKNYFGLEKVILTSCSARMVGKDDYWTGEFDKLKKTLFHHLQEKREQYINRSLSVLLKKLLEELNQNIESYNSEMKEKLKILSSNSVPNLDNVLNSIVRSGHDHLMKYYNGMVVGEIDLRADKVPEEIRRKINGELNICRKRSEISAYIDHSLSDDIRKECSVISSVLSAGAVYYSNVINEICTKMKEKMMEYYGKLETISEFDDGMTVSDTLAEKNNDLIAGVTGVDVNFSDGVLATSAVVGAGAAALIFTALGPVGWIAGAIVGLIGTDYMFIESAREKVRSSVFPKIPDIVGNIKEDTRKNALAQLEDCLTRIKDYRSLLIGNYGKIYKALSDEFERKVASIKSIISYNDAMIKDIRSMCRELETYIDVTKIQK